jgi:hypothetical protein
MHQTVALQFSCNIFAYFKTIAGSGKYVYDILFHNTIFEIARINNLLIIAGTDNALEPFKGRT